MFFPEKILSIRRDDKVLEIGPGAMPHPRSDAFLEIALDSEAEKIRQRGGVPEVPDFGDKPVYYYDGKDFPFASGQFDYVICSHVIEHVPDPETFMAEVFRVGKGRGYLEYPLITYEYLYDFPVHLHFVKFDHSQRILKFLPKRATPFQQFAPVTALFHNMLENGWDDLCAANPQLFFEGIEFQQPFAVQQADQLQELLPAQEAIVRKLPARRLLGRLLNKLGL